MSRPTIKKVRSIIEAFNGLYPVGTPVILRTDSGEVKTKVSHQAILMPGPVAVAWFEDISGCYSIDGRVRPA